MFVTCKSRLSFTNLTLCKHLFFLRVDILLCKHSLNHFMKEKIISLWTILSFPVNRASQSVENPSAGFWLVCSEDTKHWNLPPVILSDTSFMLTLEDSMDLWICQIFSVLFLWSWFEPVLCATFRWWNSVSSLSELSGLHQPAVLDLVDADNWALERVHPGVTLSQSVHCTCLQSIWLNRFIWKNKIPDGKMASTQTS